MELFMCAIFALIMARVVKKYASIPETINWILDFTIQFLHIITFICILLTVCFFDISISTVLISFYCLFYIAICSKEFILDIIYYIFTDPNDEVNTTEEQKTKNEEKSEDKQEEQ